MPELHPGTELHQARVHRGRRRLGGYAQPPGRPPDQRKVAVRLGRRHQQQPPGRRGQRLQLPAEALLDPLRQRHRAGQAEPARQLRRRQPPRQLQQRQRVALRLGHDPVPDPIIDRPGQRRAQQRPRVALPQPPDFELRQPGQRRARFTGGEDQPDRVGGQPPGYEPQHLRGRLIQPLHVIDQADQRPFPGHLRQQAQYGQPDQEPVRRRSGGHAERDPQRLPLRYRQVPGAV